MIECSPASPTLTDYNTPLPSPSATPAHRASAKSISNSEPTNGVPPLKDFIRILVLNSNVQASTLLPTLVYLERLKLTLPVAAKGTCPFSFLFLGLRQCSNKAMITQMIRALFRPLGCCSPTPPNLFFFFLRSLSQWPPLRSFLGFLHTKMDR